MNGNRKFVRPKRVSDSGLKKMKTHGKILKKGLGTIKVSPSGLKCVRNSEGKVYIDKLDV